MIQDLRQKFNKEFTKEKFNEFLEDINLQTNNLLDFTVCETPVFLSNEFSMELQKASYEIVEQVQTKEFQKYSANAVPENLYVPNEDEHPLFLQVDFGVTKNTSGDYIPKLIELQAFPSLYGWQEFLSSMYMKHFTIPEGYTNFYSGLDKNTYRDLFKRAIIGYKNPENVILLEINPWKQKTRIDFFITEKITGIKTVGLDEIKKSGNKLYYFNNGKETEIKRIYNRVIFDELIKKNPDLNFSFQDELDVEWAGHPNWFYKISKHSLPFIKSNYAPECFKLSELNNYPGDLENYVLKPLFSFAGSGVKLDFTEKDLEEIENRENYILQQKVNYEPFIITPDGNATCEIRMMFIWIDKPLLVNNLVRVSKGKMMGVDYNKGKNWIGSSAAFHLPQ